MQYQKTGRRYPFPDQLWPNPKVQQAHLTGLQDIFSGKGTFVRADARRDGQGLPLEVEAAGVSTPATSLVAGVDVKTETWRSHAVPVVCSVTMPVICDTSSVPVEDRAELWVTASSELFVPLECTPHDRASFAACCRRASSARSP